MKKCLVAVVAPVCLLLTSASGGIFDQLKRSVEDTVKKEAEEVIGDTVRDALGGEEEEPPAEPPVEGEPEDASNDEGGSAPVFVDLAIEDAIAKAGKTGRIVLIDFSTSWSPYSLQLERITWKDPSVRRWLENHAVALRVDADRQKDLLQRYKVEEVPTLLFLRPDGSEISRHHYLAPQAFLEVAGAAWRDKAAGDQKKMAVNGAEPADAGSPSSTEISDDSTGEVTVVPPGEIALRHTFEDPAPTDRDRFGQAVAIEAGCAVVGHPYDSGQKPDSGRVDLWNARNGKQLRTIDNPDPWPGAQFGRSVDLRGNYILVGAPLYRFGEGRAYLFDAVNGRLVHAFAAPKGQKGFGYRVALGSKYALVSATFASIDRSKRIAVAYQYDLETGRLVRGLEAAPFGRDQVAPVAIDGGRALVGAQLFDLETGKELRSLADALFNGAASRLADVAIEGDLVVLTTPMDRDTNFPAVNLLDVTSGEAIRTLPVPEGPTDHDFGASVALEGGLLLVGAPYASNQDEENAIGRAYLYNGTTGKLLNTFEDPSPTVSDLFGYAVAIHGDAALIGAPFDSFAEGKAHLFDLDRDGNRPTSPALKGAGPKDDPADSAPDRERLVRERLAGTILAIPDPASGAADSDGSPGYAPMLEAGGDAMQAVDLPTHDGALVLTPPPGLDREQMEANAHAFRRYLMLLAIGQDETYFDRVTKDAREPMRTIFHEFIPPDQRGDWQPENEFERRRMMRSFIETYAPLLQEARPRGGFDIVLWVPAKIDAYDFEAGGFPLRGTRDHPRDVDPHRIESFLFNARYHDRRSSWGRLFQSAQEEFGGIEGRVDDALKAALGHFVWPDRNGGPLMIDLPEDKAEAFLAELPDDREVWMEIRASIDRLRPIAKVTLRSIELYPGYGDGERLFALDTKGLGETDRSEESVLGLDPWMVKFALHSRTLRDGSFKAIPERRQQEILQAVGTYRSEGMRRHTYRSFHDLDFVAIRTIDHIVENDVEELSQHSLNNIRQDELPPKPNYVGMRDYATQSAANIASHREFPEAYSKYFGELVAEMYLANPVAHMGVYQDFSTDAFKRASKRFSR